MNPAGIGITEMGCRGYGHQCCDFRWPEVMEIPQSADVARLHGCLDDGQYVMNAIGRFQGQGNHGVWALIEYWPASWLLYYRLRKGQLESAISCSSSFRKQKYVTVISSCCVT